MLRILPTRYRDILVSDLILEYAAECSISAIGQPDPQPEIYEQMENCGLMRCFGVYRGALLIGFATVLVSILPHYGKKAATVESLFVSAPERKGLASGKLLMAVKAFAGASGCVGILCCAPIGGDFDAFLRDRVECARASSVYFWSLA